MMNKEDLVNLIVQLVSEETKIASGQIDPHIEFMHYGLDSIQGINLLLVLEKELKIEINPIALWDHPTPETLATHLYQKTID